MPIVFNPGGEAVLPVETSTAVTDARVIEFSVKRDPDLPSELNPLVAVSYQLLNGGTVLGGENFSAAGPQASNFLRQTVSGRLGQSIEQAILDGLAAAGKIPAGTVSDPDA